MSEWISVRDRLPEKWMEVLVAVRIGGVYCIGGIATRGKLEWHYDYLNVNGANFHMDGCNPTHWMPLPEPPEDARELEKEEENE